MGQKPHSSNASNSSLTKSGNPEPAFRLNLCKESSDVLLHQPIQGGFFRSVPFIVGLIFNHCVLSWLAQVLLMELGAGYGRRHDPVQRVVA
ncbi:hypothetical protein, partial [Nitrosomonas mobilis]|uniref:hypothetical protein n=1 Tax=Nitrosomonas mobilis TaxID=51642 RepID=UPI001C4096EF